MPATDWSWVHDLPFVLGPIVGHTTTARTKIWIRANPDGPGSNRFVLRYMKAADDAAFDVARGAYDNATTGLVAKAPLDPDPNRFHTASAALDGLEPDTRYLYEVVPLGRDSDEHRLLTATPFSWRTMPTEAAAADAGERLRFAFMSCNGLHRRPKGKDAIAMWERLVRVGLPNDEVRLAIFGGDQVYADRVRDEWLESGGDPYDDIDPGSAVELKGNLQQRYADVYRGFWSRPAIRIFMGNTPCLMTWDDHEIYDGYGSHGDEDERVQRLFFGAAASAFDAHQMVHNPDNNGLAKGHRAFAFTVGACGFLVLDLRTHRRADSEGAYPLIGAEQWSYIDGQLAVFAGMGISHLVVVASVPPVHVDRALTKLVPGGMELKDDVLDQWSSVPNEAERGRLLGKLFDFRKQTRANVLILGGDVHMATVGRIRTSAGQFMADGEDHAVIHQGVSSAIAYRAPTGLAGVAMDALVWGHHNIKGPYDAEIDEHFRKRNFAIVSTSATKKAFRFELHLEDQGPPREIHMAGPKAGG